MVQIVTPLTKDAQLEAARTPPHSIEAEQSVLGGLLLGVMENYGQALFGTQWRDVVAFVLLVLVLLIRPTGILGESLGKARA